MASIALPREHAQESALSLENQTLKRELAQLRSELRFVRNLLAVPASVMSASHKVTLLVIWLYVQLHTEQWTEIKSWELAEQAGQHKSTFLSNLSYLKGNMGLLRKRRVRHEHTGIDGFTTYTTSLYIEPTPQLADPTGYRVEQARQHGGPGRHKRTCSVCGTEDQFDVYHTFQCRVCGQWHHEEIDVEHKPVGHAPKEHNEQDAAFEEHLPPEMGFSELPCEITTDTSAYEQDAPRYDEEYQQADEVPANGSLSVEAHAFPITAPQGPCELSVAPETGGTMNHLLTEDRYDNNEQLAHCEGTASESRQEEDLPGVPRTGPESPSQGEQEMVEAILPPWLMQRIGGGGEGGQLIYATGKPEQHAKYRTLPRSYQPDMAKYLAGDPRHIYGSRLAIGAHTHVLCFDIDTPEQHANYETSLQQLTQAGAFPLYWHRLNGRGHLELYFSEQVSSDAAYAWCLATCPALQSIPECYPVHDKKSNALSWPLYQRLGHTVVECSVSYWSDNDGGGVHTLPGFRSAPSGVATLLEAALTPAHLIGREIPLASQGGGGPLLEKSQQEVQTNPLAMSREPDADLSRVIIAQFYESHTWEEIAALCGGLLRDRFCAVWRGERTPSVVIDSDGRYACDHGRIGTEYPKKLDKYEVWCLAQGIDKKRDLACRIREYRHHHRATRQVELPPVQVGGELVKGVNRQEVLRDEEETTVARWQSEARSSLLRGNRVMTPHGPGEVQTIRYCDLLKRERCSVMLDLPYVGWRYQIFDREEVSLLVQGSLFAEDF